MGIPNANAFTYIMPDITPGEAAAMACLLTFALNVLYAWHRDGTWASVNSPARPKEYKWHRGCPPLSQHR